MTDKTKTLQEISLVARVEIRTSKDDLLKWRLAAQRDGRTLSNWIRHTLNRTIEEVVVE
jgi:hypothetical protein